MLIIHAGTIPPEDPSSVAVAYLDVFGSPLHQRGRYHFFQANGTGTLAPPYFWERQSRSVRLAPALTLTDSAHSAPVRGIRPTRLYIWDIQTSRLLYNCCTCYFFAAGSRGSYGGPPSARLLGLRTRHRRPRAWHWPRPPLKGRWPYPLHRAGLEGSGPASLSQYTAPDGPAMREAALAWAPDVYTLDNCSQHLPPGGRRTP